MLKIKNNNVLIPLSLWKELKGDLFYNELVEAIEDREALIEATEKNRIFCRFGRISHKENED